MITAVNGFLFAMTGLGVILLSHGSSQFGAMLMAIALPMTFLAQALREPPLLRA
jgi:hypothetical protein